MFIVAGPPGGGKSKAFPVSGFGVDFFNADDHAATLNGGSYLGIPRDHVQRRASCAFEITLRSGITFEQAAIAKCAGFAIEMRYAALQDFSMHLGTRQDACRLRRAQRT